MSSNMLIWPILVFAIAICIMVVIRMKGKNSHGKYAAAAQRFVAEKMPNINISGMQCLEGQLSQGMGRHLPLLILYNSADLYMIPAKAIPIVYKLRQDEDTEDFETVYLPMKSIEHLEVADGGAALTLTVKGNQMTVKFWEKNGFQENQQEDIARFLVTMKQIVG